MSGIGLWYVHVGASKGGIAILNGAFSAHVATLFTIANSLAEDAVGTSSTLSLAMAHARDKEFPFAELMEKGVAGIAPY